MESLEAFSKVVSSEECIRTSVVLALPCNICPIVFLAPQLYYPFHYTMGLYN